MTIVHKPSISHPNSRYFDKSIKRKIFVKDHATFLHGMLSVALTKCAEGYCDYNSDQECFANLHS